MISSEKTTLRQMELHGPALAEAADHSFWRVRLIAPQHGLGLVHPKKSGTQVERTHPVRTLLIEVTRYPKQDRWRRVRLLSTHLIGGVDGTWADNDDSNFGIRIAGRDWGPLKSKNGDNFRTDVLDGKQTGWPQFHHLTAAPLLRKDEWPVPDVGENPDINCPPCRLEQGALALLFSSADQLPWIDVNALGLQPIPLQKSDDNARFRLVLVKDGIELDARAPFPGQAKPLPGHFLLAPDGTGRLILRLLPENLAEPDRTAWLAAWGNLAPSDDAKSEQLAGFKVLLNTRSVPAFSWRVTIVDGKITGLAPEVIVPAAAASVRLLGPRGVQDRDGDIALAPGAWIFSPARNPGALSKQAIADATAAVWENAPADWSGVTTEISKWNTPAILSALIVPPAPKNKKLYRAPQTSIRLRTIKVNDPLSGIMFIHPSQKGHALAHDEVLLAGALRSAQGLPEPAPGEGDPARPLLWGFTPLDDGWLQLPLPNLPQPNPAKDASLIRPAGETPPNVVSGFLRYGEAQAWPQILSAFDPANPQLTVKRAPWLVTLEGTQGVAIAVALDAGGAGPREALAHLFGPELSTRGLLWLSSDRPDAEEALPRIGAGAGQYLDVPLESHDVEEDPIVPITLRGLEFTMTESVPGQQSKVERLQLQIDIAFDATRTKWTRWLEPEPTAEQWRKDLAAAWKSALAESWTVLLDTPLASIATLPPVFWLRHPTMPLAALMAMTRSASAAVRPLESRDLVPFVLDPGKKGNPPLLLAWGNATRAVFPEVLDAKSGKPPELRPLVGWPWEKNAGDTDLEKIEQGIGLCAFGVPGAELNFNTDASFKNPWEQLQFALRFDLPALDEAFATAALPPVPKVKTSDEIDLAPPAVPVATALDWRGLQALWLFKEERHRLARVMHSYLFGYAKINDPITRTVIELVGGAEWKTQLDFKPGESTDKLPYGAATVDGVPVKGNVALLGFTGTPTLSWAHGGNKKVAVTGYAPATIEDGTFLTDARGTGLGEMSNQAGKPLWRRPVQIRTGENLEKFDLVTMQAPEEVFSQTGEPLFFFLFKDLPMDGAELALGLDPEAWQDGKLPRSGAEWRLCPANDNDATEAFKRGRDRLPFFGFGLEPLQLTKCGLRPDDRVQTVTILARLHLGPRQGAFLPMGNLVDLTFTWSDRLEITNCVTHGEPLRFHLEAGDPARGVEITAVCKWDNVLRQPVFSEVEIELPMFRRATRFKGAKMLPATAAGDPVRITWAGAKAPPTLAAGEAKFGVEEIAIEARTETTSDAARPSLTMKRWIAILPASALVEEANAQPALLFRLGPADGVSEAVVFGYPLGLNESDFDEHLGSFSLTVEKSQPLTIMPGLTPELSGAISLGWLARLPALKNGTADLEAGHLSARWVDEARPVPNRILLEAGRATRGGADRDRWLGALTLHVHATVKSAIGWPQLKKFEPGILPWPPKENPTENERVNNRVTLTFSDDEPVLDQVTYLLDGQTMSCAIASQLAQSEDETAVFALPVAAQHRFLRADNVLLLRFSSVETMVLGRAHAIIPKPLDPANGYKDDPIAFSARYRDLVKDGATTHTATKGMDVAGRGRISKLLSGALGHAFRAAIWPELTKNDPKANPLIIAGGFVGLAEWESPGAPSSKPFMAPLVRVPVLAWPGVSLALEQSEKEVTIAWTDTPVALPIAVLFRTTAVPASSAFSALCAAIQESAPSGRIVAEGFESAALVEQSFRLEMDDDLPGKLTTNFFPAAAASISKLIDHGDNRKDSPMTISMLAGRAFVQVAEDKPPVLQPFAASLLLRGQDWEKTGEIRGKQAIDPVSATSLLATLGDDVVLSPWSGPSAELARAVVFARAVAEHAEPLVALVVRIEDDASATCTAQAPSRQRTRAVYRPPVTKTVFADPARGYALNGEGHEGWLRGLEEGITRPIRDAEEDEPKKGVTRSGLAGMSHTLSLPPQTRELAAPVYFSETRAPIYQPPLDLRYLESPPISWLAPGRTRPRLPTTAALDRTLAELFGDTDVAKFFQWILPAGGVSASVGDRAGILLARLSRLEAAIKEIEAFDRAHERFGRPGQGSAWSVRTERTPRPGPLPENIGKPERDRRPCASRLEFWRPLEALRGPADTVAGEPRIVTNDDHGAWVVKMVAAADWEGMITDRFDATVALDVEMDVGSPVKVTPWEFLQRTLLPPVSTTETKRQASAELVVGSLVIPFQRLHLANPDGKFEEMTVEVSSEKFTIHRAKLRLILDARLDVGTRQPGAPLTALADALKASALLPRVEVRFTVHPDSNRDTPAVAPDPVPLTLVDPVTAVMPHGESRPPVTLRLPLAPIVRSRGALPLPINSLLFIDPAYDEQLGSAPAVHRERIARPRFAKETDSLPPNRGELFGSLYADRARVNRRAGIVFMADFALEKPLPAADQKVADTKGADGGDLIKPGEINPLVLTFAVTTLEGERRELYFGLPAPAPLPETAPLPNAPRVQMSFVYEISFSLLREKDGTPARLAAGDMLELTVTEETQLVSENGALVSKLRPDKRLQAKIWKREMDDAIALTGLDASGAANEANDIPFSRTVRVLLTDEPVVEPPSALYAALTRRATDAATRLSLPLYAQSPLPWRVALRDAKADFRKGFVRRAATFIWSLARPSSETEHTGVHIVKVDRNGQTYLPPAEIADQFFITSRKILNPNP